jgi:PKD repeat protein
VVHDGGVPLRQLHLNAGRGLLLAATLLVALAWAPAAHAAGEPIARWTCSAPGLTCDPCPVHCSNPSGAVAAGVPVHFDGRVSSDDRPGSPAGSVVAWKWSFGDGTTISSPVVDHAFGSAGSYDVDLQVFDNNLPVPKSDTKTLTIVVSAISIAAAASPQIVLGAGALTDTATVSGRSGAPASTTIDFRAYGPDDALCAGAPAFQSTVAYPAAGGPVTSAAFSPAQPGVYRWIASYGGDTKNPPVATRCSDASASVLVGQPPPPPPPPPAVVVEPPPPPVTCFGKVATIVAQDGEDVITGTSRADVIVGTDGDDTIDGRGGNDTICARGGDDTVRGSSGNDRLYGDSGDDLVLGGSGADSVYGGSGADRIAGGDGRDRVDGGMGNDVLDELKLGGGGIDRLIGGSGADRIRAADGTHDSVDCGGGRDIAQLDAADHQSHCDSVRRVARIRA